MSSSSHEKQARWPSDIAFVSLPKGLAQFHHLPIHVPVLTRRQAEVEKSGYDFQEGAGVMERLLREAPGVPGAYLYQLFVKKWRKLMEINPYFESNRIAEAIPKLVEILDIDPECPLTCFQLGYCFRVTGELEKSESFYQQALRMAPDAGWIYSNLGRTLQAKGERARAAEAFWKAFELLPGDHFVLEQLMGLGELFLLPEGGKAVGEGRFIRRADFEKKKKTEMTAEGDPQKLMKLGWDLLQDRLNDLADECFEKASAASPAPPEAPLGRGIAHLEAGRYKEAERFLGEYLDDYPQSAVAHLNLFKSYLAQDERDLAWEEILTAVRLDPHRLDSLRQLYFLFRETDRLEEGLECLDRLASENPGGTAPLLVKAQALGDANRWAEAEEVLQEALRRVPHEEETLLFYSSELGRRGKRKELIRLLEAEPQPQPLSLTINLAMAYRQSGQLEKGKNSLRGFLERPGISPQDQGRASEILSEWEGNP